MKATKVDVVFRKFPEGDVIALFPNIPEGEGEILSYQHLGQHGRASVALLRELLPATDDERAPLLRELVSLGYAPRVVRVLWCQMESDCPAPVAMLDSKGFVYYKEHGLRRRGSGHACRKLRDHEMRKLQRGETIKRY